MNQKPANRKTFVVSVLIGTTAGTPWPLGRLHISDESITVRSLFKTRTCPKSQITHISFERLGPQYQLLFEASPPLAGVVIGIVMRYKGVVAELRRRGYPVVDRRSKLFPVPQGIVPWQGEDAPKSPGPPTR